MSDVPQAMLDTGANCSYSIGSCLHYKIFKRSKNAKKKGRFIIILEMAEAFNLLLDFSGKTLEPET